LNPGCVTLGPGASKRFRFSWTHDATVVSGATVVFTGTVTVPNDNNSANNSDTETRVVV
jgi:hypothetical protein